MNDVQNYYFSRRQFLSAGAGATLSLSVQALPVSGAESEKQESETQEPETTVKFSVFADIHHFPAQFYSRAPEHLKQIQDRAVRENCDFIIHCGDFCHHPHKETEFVESYNQFTIPGFHVLGNHDQDGCSWEETLHAYHLEKGYYFFEKKGFRFVILDANYFQNEDGTCTHYSNGNYFKYKGSAICIVPPEQISWLAEVLETSSFPCVLFSHQSYEREVGGVANWQEIRDTIDSVNARHPGRVRLCINGHHHRDFLRVLNQVVYFDLNSASFDWVERTHDFYPTELCEKHTLANHTVIYEDPIHAVVTLNSDGLMRIEGMKSRMFMGVTRSKAGLPFADTSGRPVFPEVQSAEMHFRYES